MSTVNLMDKAISSSDARFLQMDVSNTASSACVITNTQVTCTAETETLTILHTLAATTVKNNTSENALVGQGSTSTRSQTVWVVMATVFLVIAVSAIVLSIFLGYFLHKKGKTMDMSTTATIHPSTIELVAEGESWTTS